MTAPVFEMFRLVPGKTEEFIRDMAKWDKVSAAGGQLPTQLFLHAGGEGWDVLLYKPARARPTPERSEEHTSELQSIMRISYAAICLTTTNNTNTQTNTHTTYHTSAPQQSNTNNSKR